MAHSRRFASPPPPPPPPRLLKRSAEWAEAAEGEEGERADTQHAPRGLPVQSSVRQ